MCKGFTNWTFKFFYLATFSQYQLILIFNLHVQEGMCPQCPLFNAVFKNSMFPWKFQKHPVPDELQMLSRCDLQWAPLVGLDISPPPPPPFGAEIKSIHLILFRWFGVKRIQVMVGFKSFLINSLPRSLHPWQ